MEEEMQGIMGDLRSECKRKLEMQVKKSKTVVLEEGESARQVLLHVEEVEFDTSGVWGGLLTWV